MKINFSRKVKDVLGREVGDGNLGWACAFALSQAGGQQGQQGQLTPEKKFNRGVLAQRIMAAKAPMEVSAEEVADIKSAVGEVFAPGLVTPIWQTLEGK